jgi:threonine dehydrogenase-like Zn-dependent dehydrogenase
VYAERQQVHMGLVWIKNLTFVTGHANVIAHLDPVLALMQAGRIDISPLVSREMPLTEAADAYEAYASHSALKIVLRP